MTILAQDYQGMSDDQLALERKAQEILTAGVQQFRALLENINLISEVESINLSVFDNFVQDELPKKASWNDKISEARKRQF